MLKVYARFEISDESGEPLSEHDMMQLHYGRITSLQKAAFARIPELRAFSLANVASVDTRTALSQHFSRLSVSELRQACAWLGLLGQPGDPPADEERFLRELLISRHERRTSQLERLNRAPLYPTERLIWDEDVVPSAYFSGEGCLALPKLNLQFLTLHDYLLRNFNLFRLESTYEIRQDVEDALTRLCPWRAEEGGQVLWGGWARMAQPITSFAVVEVAKPNIGELRPSRVRADVTVTLSVRTDVKAEWEGLRKHDVCFLVSVRPERPPGTRHDHSRPFREQVGLRAVRGCEIEGMLDTNGRVIEDGPEPRPVLPGDTRTFRVWLDCNQYQEDMQRLSEHDGGEDVYDTFNVLLRRKPKENNFKAVLETIRELMNTECVVPEWLHDIVLGYGDPGAAHYTRMPDQLRTMDWNDTFLDMEHLRASFPDHEIVTANENEKQLVRPFRLTFETGTEADTHPPRIRVEPHVIPSRGPYLFNEPRKNAIPFTRTQVEAIRSGMQPGLTLVVGPPGTGKTDVAVQIISNLYHNFPQQRTLVVTHSNQALNQLFEKIVALDIDERHLLRLGHGEEALDTDKDFSRYGRVNYVLAKRMALLTQVQRLQEALDVPGDVAYTCETARHFYLHHVLARWQQYLKYVRQEGAHQLDLLAERFPFGRFFGDAPQPLFKGRSFDEDLEIAHSCFRYVERMFAELEEFRAFELLRSGLDRSKYLLVKEAKIIAMTCTHAALKRKELVDMGFKYDNILMEEAAQILEIETFIPLLLQNPQDGYNRLKRWIMIGDHHQLPPVIKNMAFQKYSNMEQSLFTRLVRLGVPSVELDGQGRCRPSICALFKWRYRRLGDLPHVLHYGHANAGFLHDFQLVNVDELNGAGESEPSPYFYQNLAEAEYIVAVFMYMRLIGYPADSISILTTYNGQKHLIRDVISTRCADNPLVGRPRKVTTVDKYQGQQNDYILLSLVRTRAVGHVRDVRRLVVAMSRARLGLYVFARAALFRNCFELAPAFGQLAVRPQHLELVMNEAYPTERAAGAAPESPATVMRVRDMQHMANFVYQYYMERVRYMQDVVERSRDAQPARRDSLEASNASSSDSEPESAAPPNMLPVPIHDEPLDDSDQYSRENDEDPMGENEP